MSVFEPGGVDDEEQPAAPWFSNRDDDEYVPQEPSVRRRIIVAAAMVVILLLVLIPILQAAVLQRRQNELPDEAFRRTALQFTSAVYFARSTGQAMLFAVDDASDDVEDVVAYFRDRPPNSTRARVQISAAPCPRGVDASTVCFQGALFDPGAPISPGIEFGLRERDGDPRVVFVRLDQVTVRAGPLSRS